MRMFTKNAGHKMAIFREPCNVNAHVNIPVAVQLSCDLRSEHHIHPGDTTQTPDTTHTEPNVELGFPD